MIVPSKIYSNLSVLEAARRRMRWIFDEFPNVVVLFSGGKDSTVCFHLALEAARELKRLPLHVMFLDQEIEWMATIETVRQVMLHPDVKPVWVQIPFRLSNSTSVEENWLHVWDPEREDLWMRKKEPYAIKENTFGADRFHELLSRVPIQYFNSSPSNRCCTIGGVRCEESPARALGLTMAATWKWATWGKAEFAKHGYYIFYPIYDWHTSDVWKFIHENNHPYCRIYDMQFQHGLPIQKMRVSNLHHETALEALFYVHEFEGETWNRMVRRLKGLHSAAKFGKADYYPTELPPMFKDWWEYRDYLLEKLISNPQWREIMRKRFAKQDEKFREVAGTALPKSHVIQVLCNDWEGVKATSFEIGLRQKHRELQGKKKNAPTPAVV